MIDQFRVLEIHRKLLRRLAAKQGTALKAYNRREKNAEELCINSSRLLDFDRGYYYGVCEVIDIVKEELGKI